MMPVIDALARVAAERMINSVVAGIVLTILAWSLLRLLPRLNARTRVAVWLSVLAAIPGLTVAAVLITNNPSLETHPAIVVPEGWAFAILIAWALLASLALLHVGSGVWRIRTLRTTCKPIDLANVENEVRATIEGFRPKRSVALLESERARVPMAIGFVRPAVILPKWVLTELSANEISAILIHEFAHLSRWDDWANLFQKLVRAVFFFHPSIWWVDRRLALDREIACDDAVLAATNQAHDYARCLLDLAEKSLVRRSLAMAQAAVHRVQHMSVRISQILDPSRPRAPRISKIALVGITGIAGICLIAVLQSPTLIAFQGNLVGTAAKPALSGVEGAVLTARVNGKATQTGSVFPVVMREPVSSSPRFIPRSRKTNIAVAHAKPRDVVIPANLARHPEQPNVLRAELTIHQQTVIPVESILLVMPDARFDASGQVVWTLSVWRLTVFHPVQAPAEGMIPNSI